jgi:hypothetical protein
MEKHKIGKVIEIEKNPEKIGKKLKEAICNSFDERVDKNSLCKDCK